MATMKNIIYDICIQMLNLNGNRIVQCEDDAQNVGLHLAIEVSVDNHGYMKDGNTHVATREAHFFRVLHFIITNRHRVYYAVSEVHRRPKPEEYVNLSNHDSCWRSALDKIDECEFEGYEHCFCHPGIPESERGSFYDNHSRIRTQFARFGTPLRYVKIQRGPLPKADHYFDRLVGIEPLEFVVNVSPKDKS